MRVFRRLILLAAGFSVSFTSFSRLESGQNSSATASNCKQRLTWLAQASSTSDRLKLLISLLGRHPNIVTANLSFQRSLLATYAHVPGLQAHLGKNAASFETAPPIVRRARYVATGEAQYNQEAIGKFLEARVADIQGLELVDGGDLLAQVRHLKKNSRRTLGAPTNQKSDGTVGPEGREVFDEKVFTKMVRRLLQVVPFVFDSEGNPQFSRWAVDRENIIAQIRASTPQDLENRYGDLLKEHLEKQIRAIASERFVDPETGREQGLGQVKILYENVRNQFLDKELRRALTPISRNGVAEERTLSIESLPAWVSPVRGCYGGDCSIKSVPYYSLVKGAKVHFIRKTDDLSQQPSGYVMSVPVLVNGKTVPYILTINGMTLAQVDVEMAVRMVVDDYQSNEVVFPDFKAHPNLVNTDAARSGMTLDKRKSVTVTFPAGWAQVDSYMKTHQVKGYKNYYNGPDIERGYLSSVPSQEARLLEPMQVEESEVSRYQEVRDLLQIPLIQRGILGVQALSASERENQGDNQAEVSAEEVTRILNLTDGQIQAARPLIEVSSTRSLSLKEYRLAEDELGFGLSSLLELEGGARAATLKTLYREEPQLFTEHQARNNPRAINALIDAYGPTFPEEVRSILKAKDLSDGRSLQLLEALKSALTEGDLSKSAAFQKRFEGTSLEGWAREAIPRAFIRMNTADTALGRKLEAALRSSEASFALLGLKQPVPRDSQTLQAFQGIAALMETQHLSFDQARDRWLSDEATSLKSKARFLGLHFNSPEFEMLFHKIPESQKQDVLHTMDEFSVFRVFTSLGQEAKPDESETPPRRSLIQRFLGRKEEVAAPKPVSRVSVPRQLVVESFEYVDAPIPSGGVKFMMGSPPTEADRSADENQVEVTLTRPFQMQRGPVTQWQYERVMGKNPSRFSTGEAAINRPGEQISWDEAQAYLQRLSELDPKWDYRLPTEAEWEFMARAGTATAYSFGNDVADLKDNAHFSENSGSETHPLTEKRPNPWGLYDMHGNVWEWTSDWYSGALPGGVDPRGPDTGSDRVIRGGSWYNVAQFARSASRSYVFPGFRYGILGFRPVRTPKVLR